jgi:Retrotransposon gag protein
LEKPKTFNGEKANYRQWKQTAQWYLFTQDDIKEDAERIMFYCSLMTEGTALKWKSNYLRWVEKEILFQQEGDNYDEFLKKMDEHFMDPHEERRAKEAIANMKQGTDRAEVFFRRFKMAMQDAGYDNIFHEDYMVNLLY